MEALYGKMSPSPATRISPRKDLRADNHKRQHSLESRTSHRDKEYDDLALFNEVRDKERENFLLDSNDNFDDIFSTKIRYLSEHKLGIAVPSRGQSSDLLNDEGNKNDYDWLITPPETPLFPSLDDESPLQVNHAQTGRPRNQPIPISPSPMMERGQKSSRASASPHRRSPSPRPSKPFSVTRSSPPSATGHFSPSRGSSPPPRSSTPTPRRIISSTTAPSTVRGASPIKTGRGNSAVPKIKAWQSSIPGFSSEAPPNLRTSLFDRPASYVRGSSPASRNGKKSRSPSASRSIGSSRGSVVSSGDDDQDSLRSVPVAGRDVGISRKQTRGLSSSAPKRSLDLGRQMDRKSPANMFRPLLSSVPSSTFHAGHASSPASKYPSISARSNPSTNLGASGPHDTEISEPNQEEMTNDPFKGHDPYADDNIFVMDEAHGLSDDNKIMQDPPGSHLGELDSPSKRDIMDAAVTIMDVKSDFSDASGLLDMVVVCSICGLILNSSEEIIEGDPVICHECKNSESNPTTITPVEISDQLKGKKYIEKISNEGRHPKTESMQNLSTQPTEVDELIFASRLVIKQLQQDGCGSNSGAGAPKKAGNFLTIRSRSFTASNTSFDDISCARDSSNSKKSTFSASVSSSFDLGGFSRQTEGRICRQSSGQRSDVENYRYEMPIVHIRSDSSMSSASVHMLHVPSEDGFEEFEEKTCSNRQEQEKDSTCVNTEKDYAFRTQELVPVENNENLTSDFSDFMNVEALPAETEASAQEEDVGPLSSCADRVDNSEFPDPSTFDGVSEIVNEDADVVSDVDTTDRKSCMNEIQDDEDITEFIKGLGISGPGHHVCDEWKILSEDMCETKLRSLKTVEETTDAILFCSSIVHNIAYEAANIAISKETPPTEVLRATVAILGGPDSKRRDNTRLRTMRKRSSRAQRARQKKPEMDAKPPCNGDDDENSSPIIVGVRNEVDSLKPPKLESKCNCVIM